MANSRKGEGDSAGAEAGGKYISCDPLAVAVAIDPAVAISRSVRVWCDVEVQGSALTRGMCVFDWKGLAKREDLVGKDGAGDSNNVVVIKTLDMDRFYRIMQHSTT